MTTIVRNIVALVDDESGRELVLRVETIDGSELIEVSNDTMSKWITGRRRALRGSKFINWLKVQRSHASNLFQDAQVQRPTTRAARAIPKCDASDGVNFRRLSMPPFDEIPGCSLDVRVPKKPSDRVQVRLDEAVVDYIKKRLRKERSEGPFAKRLRQHDCGIPEGCRISWNEKHGQWRALKPAKAASNNKTVLSARFTAKNSEDTEKALAKQRAIDWCFDDMGGGPEEDGGSGGECNPNESDAGESGGASAEE